MPKILLDGTRCWTTNCSLHEAEIYEIEILSKHAEIRSKEENWFIASRQYHPTLNPKTLAASFSTELLWWACPVAPDHVWQALKRKRLERGQGCPMCAGKIASSTNNLALIKPHFATQFNEAKNGMRVAEITWGSNRRCWWICSKGHEWEASPKERARGNFGCRQCLWQSMKVEKDYSNSLEARAPAIAAEFLFTENGITPDKVPYRSNTSYLWACSAAGHVFPCTPASRTVPNGTVCPYCSNKKTHPTKSLLALHPEIAATLNTEASGFTAADVVPGSPKTAVWNCAGNGNPHTWRSTVRNVTGAGNRIATTCTTCSQVFSSAVEKEMRAQLGTVLKLENQDTASRLPLAWRRRKTMSVDVCGFFRDVQVAVEYDGAYYHKGAQEQERDEQKTEVLLAAGYRVVRVREYPLATLPRAHPNLLQLNYKYASGVAGMTGIAVAIEAWLSSTV